MLPDSIKALLMKVSADIDRLPKSAIQLVGALISLQDALPQWLSEFIMLRLSERTDMTMVSPAAEAVMRLQEFFPYIEMEFAREEIRTQLYLIKALALEDKVLVATSFLQRLAEYIEETAASDSVVSRMVNSGLLSAGGRGNSIV